MDAVSTPNLESVARCLTDACGLKPIRSGYTQGVHGVQKTEAYVVNLYLPDKLVFYELTVVKVKATDVWWDVLVGMDILTTGDFALTNKGGVTMFSFRYPSRTHIDFNKECHEP